MGSYWFKGAVNVAKKLALASGGTVGSEESVKQYAKLSNDVLALEAEVDRRNRSPLDITSKNTFLGSIVWKYATFAQSGPGLLGGAGRVATLVHDIVWKSASSARAEDGTGTYLTNFGDCERLENIGAVGTATCSAIITFDTSTLKDTFNDPEFLAFVESNTELSNGVRKVKNGSVLANFILYNDERVSPIGVTDGGILTSLKGESSTIPVISNIVTMIQNFLGASEDELKVASGEAFVNSSTNSEWKTYKYAQRYVALSRATAVLRQYDGGETAYVEIPGFEGTVDPVVAFIESYSAVAAR